jgi:hypothetical protein
MRNVDLRGRKEKDDKGNGEQKTVIRKMRWE